MNVLEKILEEIDERISIVKNIPVNEDDDFLDGEECYENGRVQGRLEELVWCRDIIRSHMDGVSKTTDVQEVEGIDVDNAIRILKDMQSPIIDYAEMVGAPAFCYGKRYVFQNPEDYAIETALAALNEKKERDARRAKDINVPSKDGWIPVEERLPEEKINPITKDFYAYPVTFESGGVRDIRYYPFGMGHWWKATEIMDEYVKAWMPIPASYKPKEKDDE